MSKSKLNWKNVKSSLIDRVAYNNKEEDLYIQFHNERVYIYHSVPQTVFEELQMAKSLGKYFHSNIKDQFTFEEQND